jgi:hypothetical protein
MATLNWIKSDNFFDTITDGNYQKAKLIFDSHDIKLHNGIADADILADYNFSHPAYANYATAYGIWDALRSSNPANTQNVVELLDELAGTKIRQWDINIQVVYDNKTAAYKKLMPHKRYTFQRGTIETRTNALNNLVAAIGNDAKLSAVKTDIVKFISTLNTAKQAKQGQSAEIDTAIVALDAARLAAAQVMYRTFGSLIKKFYTTPKAVDAYFPVELLQTKSQVVFTTTLDDQLPYHLFKRKLDAGKQQLKATNYGSADVKLYFTNGLTDSLAAGTPFVTLAANSTHTYNPGLLNYNDDNRHLYVQNTGTGVVNVEVEID